jgi:hypothetical protein
LDQPVSDPQDDLVFRVSLIHQKPFYNLLPPAIVVGAVIRTETHVADGTARDQLASAEMLPDCSLRDQPAFCKPVKDVHWGLMVRFAVIRNPAINAPIAVDDFIYALETHFSFTSVVLLLYPTHGIST